VLPPLSGWVLGYVALVLAEAFNPNTAGFLHALGGFRQLLEWVPFFFFGFALMRSKRSFRKAFLILGVAALANGVISTYQTFLSPGQVASWGPGYHNKIYPPSGHAGRSYSSEGEGRVRPLGLGSDSGFGGGVGLLALPCALALLATWRGRRRWLIVILNLGAIVAIVTSLGRLQVVGAAIGVVAFTLLSSVAGRRVRRPLAALLGVVVLAVPLGALFVSTVRSGTFSRYEKLSTSSSTSYKSSAWKKVPHLISIAPFGVGLGSVGPVASLGGKVTEQVEGRQANAETQWNFLVDEVGAPGLLLWVGLALTVISLAIRRLRRIRDVELRVSLAAVVAPLIALIPMGFSGPLSTSAALGPYYWFAAGVAAYWFAGPGWASASRARDAHGERALAGASPSPAAGL
jgi:O-antigen ligase